MFENTKPAQINHALKFTRKDKKDFARVARSFTKTLRFNQKDYTYKYNGLEIYVTVYRGKHPTFDLTTDYFNHTFSSNPKDIGCYTDILSWTNLQGCWNNDQKMYSFVTNNLINYDQKTAEEFKRFKQLNPNWNNPLGNKLI